MCVCSLWYQERKAHATYYIAICSLPGSTKSFHIISLQFFFGGGGEHVFLFSLQLLSLSKKHLATYYDGWNFNSGNYLFTTDTK